MQLVFFNESAQQPIVKRGAVFLDRDGTLIRHVDYLHNPEEVELQPGVREAVLRLLDSHYHVFIFTNQSGVGRGYFKLEDVFRCQQRMFELLGVSSEDFSGYCIAPEHPRETGGYRKPSPRFIVEALEHFGMAREDSHMVGDTCVDLETAWAAGVHPWLVLDGKVDPMLMKQVNRFKKPFRKADSLSSVVAELLLAS